MSFRYYPSIFNEINNKIRQSTSYVDCKLMFFDGSLVVNFAKLVAAGFWWTRFNNFLKKICNLVAFHLKPRGCLVVNNKICEQRQYAIRSCAKNEQGVESILSNLWRYLTLHYGSDSSQWCFLAIWIISCIYFALNWTKYGPNQ